MSAGVDGVSVVVRRAETRSEVEAAAAIRHTVFVLEQELFDGSDRDRRDDDDATIHLIAAVDGQVAGTVRIYRLDDPGTWLGDRLAVASEFRVLQLGAALVRLAVRTAGELGGDVMHAHIQLPNVRFFERLGWHAAGPPEDYLGARHQPMSITLRSST
jgi:putative N-acetyltransferase (TIGR04045 family)